MRIVHRVRQIRLHKVFGAKFFDEAVGLVPEVDPACLGVPHQFHDSVDLLATGRKLFSEGRDAPRNELPSGALPVFDIVVEDVVIPFACRECVEDHEVI